MDPAPSFLQAFGQSIRCRCHRHIERQRFSLQLGQEKEELEPWLIKEMDQLLTDVWLKGNEEVFDQIFHLIMSENVSGMHWCNII